MNAMENWKPIPGHEGRYEVSDHGRVRSLLRGGRFLTQCKGTNGYRYVGLYVPGRRGSVRAFVHVLVLEAFVGPRPDGYDACHLNDDRECNLLENLQWGTRRENMLQKVRNGRHPKTKLTECPQGHPYDNENTYISPVGHRSCRACRAAAARRHRARMTGV